MVRIVLQVVEPQIQQVFPAIGEIRVSVDPIRPRGQQRNALQMTLGRVRPDHFMPANGHRMRVIAVRRIDLDHQVPVLNANHITSSAHSWSTDLTFPVN